MNCGRRVFALLASVTLLAASANRANALGGVNLSWDGCAAEGVAQKDFACTTNTGFDLLVGSVALTAPVTRLVGDECYLDLQFGSEFVPNWWQSPCRSNSQAYMAVTDFSGSTTCLDPLANNASGAIAGAGPIATTPSYANRVRLGIAWAVGGGFLELPPGEYFAFKLRLLHNKSVGTGACAGCLTAACIVFNTCNVAHPLGDVPLNDVVNTPILRNWVQWHTGTIGVGPNGGSGCPGATPARLPTWGSVKSLYR